MDKSTVDPNLNSIDQNADVLPESIDFFPDVCIDTHSEELSANGSCINQSEVDRVSFADSEYPESWEAPVCTSGTTEIPSVVSTKCSDLVKELKESSRSTPNIVCSDSEVFGTMKTQEIVSSQHCSLKETCEDIFSGSEKHCVTTEYSQNSTSVLDSCNKCPSVSHEMSVRPSSTNQTIHYTSSETRTNNSSGLSQSSVPNYGPLNCGSDFSSVEVDSLASSSERSTVFASPASLQALDPLKPRRMSEVDFQRIEELRTISPSSSPICRRSGPMKVSSPLSSSMAHHCSLCGKQYRHVASLRNHMRKHTSGILTSKRYKCNHCVYSSQYHRNVIKHMDATHRSHETFSSMDTPHFSDLSANSCGTHEDMLPDLNNSRVWIPYTKVEQNLYSTMSNATTSKDSTGFLKVEQYIDPQFTSHQTQPSYDPRILNRHFEDDYAIKNPGCVPIHHNISKSLRCEISGCEQTFQSVKYLSNHMKDSHRDLKRFKCPLEGCTFGGLRRMHLKRHINEFHSDMKLSLYRVLERNKLDCEPYSNNNSNSNNNNNSVQQQHTTVVGCSSSRTPESQISERQQQYCNPQLMNSFTPMDTTNYSSNESSFYHQNSDCSRNDVYSFPMSSLPTQSSREFPSSSSSASASSSLSSEHNNDSRSSSSILHQTLFRSTMNHENTSTLHSQQNSYLVNNKVNTVVDGLDMESTYPPSSPPPHPCPPHSPSSMSTQLIHHYRQDDSDKLSSHEESTTTTEQVNNCSLLTNPQYSSVSSSGGGIISSSSHQNESLPTVSSSSNITEADVVEQLLNKTDTSSDNILDHILCEQIEEVSKGNDEEEYSEHQHLITFEDKIKTSLLLSSSSVFSPKLPINNNSTVDMNVTGGGGVGGGSDNVLSETDAFFSDLQEILARDMPMLMMTSSTPRCSGDSSSSYSSSDLVVDAVKEMMIESKSPTAVGMSEGGGNGGSGGGAVGGCKLMTSNSSLPSTDSGHECWSSSSSCSAGPNSTSVWGGGGNEQVGDENQQHNLIDDYDSHDDQLAANNKYTKSVYGITEGVVDDGVSVSPCASFTASQQMNKIICSNNTTPGGQPQSFHNYSNYGSNFAQNPLSPVYCPESTHSQFPPHEYPTSNNRLLPGYKSSDNHPVVAAAATAAVNHQQNFPPYFPNHNSHLSNEITPPNQETTVFNCRQINQYPFTSLSSSSYPSESSTYHHPHHSTNYVQSKYPNYKVGSEMDKRQPSLFRGCYPPPPTPQAQAAQEQVYWQSNTKYRSTGPCEQQQQQQQIPMNSSIPYRNMLVNGRESFPYENSMPYSQYNNFPASTQVMHSTMFNNNTNTNNNSSSNDMMNKLNSFQHFEQFPVRNTNCPTKYSQHYPDNDHNNNLIINNNNNSTGYNRNLQVNHQSIIGSKRWPTTSESQRCPSSYNAYNPYPLGNNYQSGQPSIQHSNLRSKLDNSDPCIHPMNHRIHPSQNNNTAASGGGDRRRLLFPNEDNNLSIMPGSVRPPPNDNTNHSGEFITGNWSPPPPTPSSEKTSVYAENQHDINNANNNNNQNILRHGGINNSGLLGSSGSGGGGSGGYSSFYPSDTNLDNRQQFSSNLPSGCFTSNTSIEQPINGVGGAMSEDHIRGQCEQ
ncbi:unnamed protein product [Trichobilharzia szidati]|nr:unnamed protein product [Trichobilharzia szidati]